MKLFEFQAKEIFAEAGIPIPKSKLVTSPDEIDAAIAVTGLPCVLKSQVLTGGRGKAGLIKFVKTADEAKKVATELFGRPENVKKILVEEAINIQKELYLAITTEPVSARALIMGCYEGGVDIEEISAQTPEKIIKEYVDINLGLQSFQINDFLWRMGLRGDESKHVGKMLALMSKVFRQRDAELVEINPVMITPDGMVAGDGKLMIDDNSMFRQPNFETTRDYYDSDMEFQAALEGIPYIQFDGDISLMCAGAGLTTTVFDLVNYEGGSVANYLEFGGPNYRKAGKAMELCLQNKSKVILIVTFGTIARADVMAKDIIEAIARQKPDRPIVTCIRGTGEEEARRDLHAAGLECLTDTEEAVRKAIAIAKGA